MHDQFICSFIRLLVHGVDQSSSQWSIQPQKKEKKRGWVISILPYLLTYLYATHCIVIYLFVFHSVVRLLEGDDGREGAAPAACGYPSLQGCELHHGRGRKQ